MTAPYAETRSQFTDEIQVIIMNNTNGGREDKAKLKEP